MPTLLGEEKEEILRAARAKKVHDIQKKIRTADFVRKWANQKAMQ